MGFQKGDESRICRHQYTTLWYQQNEKLYAYLVITEVVSLLQFFDFGEDFKCVEVIDAINITQAIIQDSSDLGKKHVCVYIYMHKI